MRLFVGLMVSAILHLSVWLALHAWLRAPDLGVQFQVPIDMDWGVEQPIDGTASAPAGSKNDTPETQSDQGTGVDGAGEGAPRPVRQKKVKQNADQATGVAEAASSETLSALTAKKGGFLGLELNLKQVRTSPLAPDVRRMLTVLPDWNVFLGNSGIDVVNELDTLMMASSDLKRANVIVTGQHPGGLEAVRQAAVRQAHAFGTEPTWSETQGRTTVSWPTQDGVDRKLATLNEKEFVIARASELSRVMGVVGTIRNKDASSLFGADDKAYLSLHIEGLRRYVQFGDTSTLPTRLRLVVRPATQDDTDWLITGEFENSAQADVALKYWKSMRDRFSRSGMVMLLGLSSVLQEAQFHPDGSTVKIQVKVSRETLQLILNWVHNFFQPEP